MSSGSNSVVELLTHDPNLEGLNPAAAGNSTGRKKIERKTLLFDYGFLIIKKRLSVQG